MLQLSVHVAISLYCVAGVMSGISSLMLPIETKGREMEVSHYIHTNAKHLLNNVPKQKLRFLRKKHI